MCGIFAYLGQNSLSVSGALKVLRILESDQELGEKTPVGGHGAGIAYLNEKDKLTLTKVAKTKRSPVADLTSQLETTTISSSLILGHVRRASPQFEDTTQHKEFAQPYKPNCKNNLSLISAHNGFLQNYQTLSNNFTSKHNFESRKIKLNDSEVVAHLYEDLLTQINDPTKAAHSLYEQVEGNNTAVILTINKNQTQLQAIQKGKTRGLVVWLNPQGEALLCSREKPVKKNLHKFLKQNKYNKIIQVTRNDSANIQTHFTLKRPQ